MRSTDEDRLGAPAGLLTTEELTAFRSSLTLHLRRLERDIQRLSPAEREARWGVARTAALPETIKRTKAAIGELEVELQARRQPN